MTSLKGKKVAIIASDGFEASELREPKQALEESGAVTTLLTPSGTEIREWAEKDWGDSIAADGAIKNANPEDFDSLLIPGGTLNCDSLRMNQDAVGFVRKFFEAHKPVAAICHGPQLLIEAKVVDGREVTSYPSLQTDLKNAGANWVDQEVVVDEGLTTSRSPKDLPAFISKMIEEIKEGPHSGQTT